MTTTNPSDRPRKRKPVWLTVKANMGAENDAVMRLIRSLDLHTVCQEAHCPNRGECFSHRTATFLILGDRCTRRCRYCAVEKGVPSPPDPEEPHRLAEAVKTLGLRHVVITSVTRDDLPDGGAAQFAQTIRSIHADRSGDPPTVEVLIPDLQGNPEALRHIIEAGPEIVNHNVETVPRLYNEIRPGAAYERSLALLARVKHECPDLLTKSGLMVGLGETPEEIEAVMRDVRLAGCDMLTIGQYLAPSADHYPIVEYVHPDQFEAYRAQAISLGFAHVASGPLVRSSYLADQAYRTALSEGGIGGTHAE